MLLKNNWQATLMIASLMMYLRPELVSAHTRYWSLIREQLAQLGVDSPKQLSQDEDEFHVWQHPQLVLSQTCGMPYRLWLHKTVTLVGTPDFKLDDCPPGYYRSALVIRADDSRSQLSSFQTATFAYNQVFSQSGFAAPYWHLQEKNAGFWFTQTLHTQQHLASARAVADGRADIAALDAVSWRLIQRYEPLASSLTVLDWTRPTPGLPLITAGGRNRAVYFQAVKSAIEALSPDDQSLLGLYDLVWIPEAEYRAIPTPNLAELLDAP